MSLRENLCREQFGDRATNFIHQAELVGNLCLIRDFDFEPQSYSAIEQILSIESRFEAISYGSYLNQVNLFSKPAEESLTIDHITDDQWRLLFHFARDYLIKQEHTVWDDLTLEEDEDQSSDEAIASSDRHRQRFERIDTLSAWFQERCCRKVRCLAGIVKTIYYS